MADNIIVTRLIGAIGDTVFFLEFIICSCCEIGFARCGCLLMDNSEETGVSAGGLHAAEEVLIAFPIG